MLEARVASAWIRRMSMSGRGDNEGEGAEVATWLPDPGTVALASTVGIAMSCLIRRISASVPRFDEWAEYAYRS